MTAQDDWLDVLTRTLRDVSEFAATGDYRLEGALMSLSSEARKAAVVVRAAQPRRPRSRLVSLVEAVQP